MKVLEFIGGVIAVALLAVEAALFIVCTPPQMSGEYDRACEFINN